VRERLRVLPPAGETSGSSRPTAGRPTAHPAVRHVGDAQAVEQREQLAVVLGEEGAGVAMKPVPARGSAWAGTGAGEA